MSYLNVYFSRINHLGETTAERIRNGGIRSFEKWMAESPHTIRNLSVERGLYFDGIILTNKDKEHEKIMFLNVANDIPLCVGDIMNWTIDDGSVEKWLLVQEEKKVNGTYRTFWIVRCNYLMKWIDAEGHIQQSWSYFVSSLDSKIKGNYRTWHDLITPQPNKYAELLLPRHEIDRSTNFIVENESWTVIEYDHTSVPGVIYLSLTENKVNMIYDDLENNIADTDRLAVYDLVLPEQEQKFSIGDVIDLKFTITKNGIPYTGETEIHSKNPTVIKRVNGVLTAVSNGDAEMVVTLKDYPSVEKHFTITVDAEEKEFSAYIEGADTIRLDRKQRYQLIGTTDVQDNVTYSVSSNLVYIEEQSGNMCVLHANAKNVLGEFELIAEYNGKEYSKTITVIPLW